MEAFARWLRWRIQFGDLDHYEYGQRLASGLSYEDKLWYSVYFGMTYQAGMARVIYDNIGNGLTADLLHVQEWTDQTYPLHRYNKDARYNKGRIAVMLDSIQKNVKPFGSLSDWLDWHTIEGGHPRVEKEMHKEWYKFGPMCSWLACQFFQEVGGCSYTPVGLPRNYSVFTCYAYLLNQPEVYQFCIENKKPHPSQIASIDSYSRDLLEEMKAYLPEDIRPKLNMFNLETHFCQFRKMVLGRDFPGHSAQNQYEFYDKLIKDWPTTDFTRLGEVFDDMHHPLIRRRGENKALRLLFQHTGQFWFLHEIYPDLPNMQKILGLQDEDFSNHDRVKQSILEYTLL